MVTSITGEYIPAHLTETKPDPAYYNDGHKIEQPQSIQSEQVVKLSISPEARSLVAQIQGEFLPAQATAKNSYSKNSLKKDSKRSASQDGDSTESAKTELSEGEKEQVRELQERDSEVRAHEQKHVASAGGYVRGGPTYEYQAGPDGRLYAIGGEVQLDTSMPDDPDEALIKARTLRASALASGDPSSADMSIASYATQMEAQAREEKVQDTEEKPEKKNLNSDKSLLNAYKKALQEDTLGIYVNYSA